MISKEYILRSSAVPAVAWSFGEALFDEVKWELRVRGVPVELEPRPLEILLLLLRHAGEVVSREELLLAAWGHAHFSENTLSNAVAKLRRALGDEEQSIVVTVHRVGYRLAVPVMRQELPGGGPRALSFQPGDPVPGREPWKLLRPLAPACNHEVWLGENPAGGERRVFKFSGDGQRLSALKREATLSRLLQEALEGRPDIVRVLDWNFERAPFFIECEYGGVSLPEWAQAQGGLAGLPLSERLRLVAQIAEAVAAAHSVGVLHKDLKPSNILVDRATPADQAGGWLLRLTDFGSGGFSDPARLAELGALRMGFTQAQDGAADSRSGSPLYLAPELLEGHAPTVQSDIYALGVILYQVIVGDLRRPLAPGWERHVADELLRQDIADAACGDPSHRLSSARELTERLQTLEQRHRQLEATRANLARQEATQRALDRTRARRPWLTALVLSMTAGLLLSLWFFRLSIRSRDEALQQYDIAQAVNDFLNNDLMAGANPNAGGSDSVTLLEALRKATDKIDARFAASPQIALALHQTVGSTYRALGVYAAAETEFRRAKLIADTKLGPESDPAVGNDLLLAQVLAYESRYPEAQAILARIENMARRRSFADPMIPVRLSFVRALFDRHNTNLLAAARNSDEALRALEQLRAGHPKFYGANAQSIFLTRLHAAQDFQDAGRRQEAERIERDLLQEMSASRGMVDPLSLRVRQQLIANLAQQGRVAEAASMLPGLVRDARLILGASNHIYLSVVSDQALVSEKQGHWRDALAASAEAEQGYRLLLGALNDATVLAMTDSARILAESGQAQQAVARYTEARAAAIQIQGDDGLLVQLVTYGLVDACLDASQTAQAAALLDTLRPEALQNAAPDAAWVPRLDFQRGRLVEQSGQPELARRYFIAAMAQAQREPALRSDISIELKKLQ